MPKEFISGSQISEEDLNMILEAANWAPTHQKNEPWRYSILWWTECVVNSPTFYFNLQMVPPRLDYFWTGRQDQGDLLQLEQHPIAGFRTRSHCQQGLEQTHQDRQWYHCWSQSCPKWHQIGRWVLIKFIYSEKALQKQQSWIKY